MLPPEMRNSVYRELFLFSDQREAIHVDSLRQNSLAFFTTSHQYHDEAASFFYTNNHFAVDGDTISTDGATLLPPIADRYVPYIKRLTLSLRSGPTDVPRVQQAADRILYLMTIGASVEEITINISASPGLGGFLNDRFDDSVMDKSHCYVDALTRLISSRVSKQIRIQLDHAWFGPSVATCLKALSDEHANSRTRPSLSFFIGSSLSPEIPVTDLKKCERALRNRYFHSPAALFDSEHALSNSTSDSSEPLDSPTSTTSLSSLMEMNIDSDSPGTGYDMEKENFDDIDGDLDDLIPIDGVDHWLQTVVDFMPGLL